MPGTIVYDYSSTMNREMYVDICKDLIHKVVVLLAGIENHGITNVYVQTDSAGGHGGGRGNGMQKSLEQINKYATEHVLSPFFSHSFSSPVSSPLTQPSPTHSDNLRVLFLLNLLLNQLVRRMLMCWIWECGIHWHLTFQT
jgi:hypothetical protein